MADCQDVVPPEVVRDGQEVPEIGKGVRRLRSDVMRRPRSQALRLSPQVLKDFPSSAKQVKLSPNNERVISPSSGCLAVNSDDKRRDRVDELAAGDETVQGGDDPPLQKSCKSIVYVRRGEGDRQSDGREDGDEKRGGQKLNAMRKSDASEKVEAWKSSRTADDRDDSSGRDSGRGTGGGRRVEKSWKEIAEREEGKLGMQQTKHRKGSSDGSYVERTNGAKVGGRAPTKLKVKVGGSVHCDSSAALKQDLGSSDFWVGKVDGRAGKAQEPAKKRRHRLILQDYSDDDDDYSQPVPIKKETEMERENDEDVSASGIGLPSAPVVHSQGVRKSSRVPKKKVLEDFEDDLLDDVMREGDADVAEPSGKMGSEKAAEDDDTDYENCASPSDKDARVSDDGSDDHIDEPKSKRQRPQQTPKTPDTFGYIGRRNAPLTARQRTMQLGKEGEADVGLSLIEFPTGLTHSSRRGREKLTEEERKVKKAEAATRRKQLVEKAANEIQATAIQKILGQDSSRKRKEERLQKQREEIEQGKKAAALEPAYNNVRWIMGPNGTTVSWSQDVELPCLFSSGPPRYPPPREKCGVPSCTNIYRYRDSKSSLPLCSLRCYQASQHMTPNIAEPV